MERFGWWERACRIKGILIVATEPVAARRRWCLRSEWWSDALKGFGFGFGFVVGVFWGEVGSWSPKAAGVDARVILGWP